MPRRLSGRLARVTLRAVLSVVSTFAMVGTSPVVSALESGADGAVITPPAHIAPYLPGATELGQGRFRYFGFHIYDASLWVSQAGFDVSRPDATPFALDIDYARHFTSAEIAKTTVDEFERMQYGMPNGRADMMARLEKLIPDVSPGQHLTAVFLPGQGLLMFSNGVKYAEDRDPAFAHAFFAIWLDERTKAPGLRAALLGFTSAKR